MEQHSTYFSLPDFLYNNISQEILSGKYKAGDQLVEGTFQEQYCVSKSPVREAFQMLINAGLVERKARRGCFVKVLTQKEVRQIYEIRMLLEGLAAREAYELMTADELASLRLLYEEMTKAAEANDSITYFHHHNAFQRLFGEISGNSVLVEICEKLRVQNMWYNMQFYAVDLFEDLHTHDVIIDHFLKHDLEPSEIQTMMQDHVGLGLKNFLQYCEASK